MFNISAQGRYANIEQLFYECPLIVYHSLYLGKGAFT